MYKQGRDRLHAPSPDAQADGHRGPAGPQDRPRLLHLRGARTRPWSSPTRSPRPPAAPPGAGRAGREGRASSARARWPPGIIEVFAKAGYDVLFVARGEDKVAAVRGAHRALARQGRAARQAHRGGARRGAGAGHRHDARWTTSPTSTSSSRPSSRSSRSRRRCSRPRRDLQAGRVLATTTSSLPVVELRGGHEAPARRRRSALLQPGADHEAGRGRAHGRHRRRRRRHRRRGLPADSASTRCTAATAPGFIVNALLFPYLNDAVRMLEAHYATRRRHRHRDEDRLRLPDGPVRAARRRRPRRLAGDPAHALPASSASRASRRRRCSSTWSRPGYLGRKTGRGFRTYD